MPTTAPKLDPAQIIAHILEHSRQPFTAVLAQFLACAPTDKAIKNEAEKFPNRWTQNIVMLARAAGYTDKTEVEVTFLQKIQQLSDSELEAELLRLEADVAQTEQGQAVGPPATDGGEAVARDGAG